MLQNGRKKKGYLNKNENNTMMMDKEENHVDSQSIVPVQKLGDRWNHPVLHHPSTFPIQEYPYLTSKKAKGKICTYMCIVRTIIMDQKLEHVEEGRSEQQKQK